MGGFAILFIALFRDRILPAPDVDVARVLATTSESTSQTSSSSSATGKMLFQASGWIEPDPLPIRATSLIDGVVKSVTVLEGQAVEKGDVIATLIDDDAKLALESARQMERTLTAEKATHLAAIETVRRSQIGARARSDASAAQRDESADRLKRYDRLSRGAVSESEVVSARLRLSRGEAEYLSSLAAADEISAEIKRLEQETEEKDAAIASAKIEVAKAELALSRTAINAPVTGRVLRLLAAPGQKKMLAGDMVESSTIAVLYDPEKLQVRVDVPLADAAGLQVGQQARIRCSLLPDSVFHGEVTRVTGEADLQRNTLQAKVRIDEPVEQLRPEMLCRVEFLGSDSLNSASAGGSLATWIPEASLAESSVWVFDPETKRVSIREVVAGNESREGFLQIESGLRPGELVVLSPHDLSAGQRVNPNPVKP